MAGPNITVGILRALLTLDTAQFHAGMRESAESASKFEGRMRKIGGQITSIGSQLTASVTLPIVAAFGGAAKAAIDFESSFAGVRKTVDASEAEFAVMAQQFRDLAKTIPVNVNDLNRLGEAAGALGIPKDEIVGFAKVMAELGVTTNVTADQAADSIAKIQNIFGASGKSTENFASTLVDLGNKGASTEAEILALATRIASAGNTVNMTQAQVLGFSSAIANVGMEAEAGGSAFSRVVIEMAKAVSAGGKDLQNFAQVAGMTAPAFAKLFRDDAAAATVKFVEGLGKIKTSGGDLNATLTALGFVELRQSDLLRRLAGSAQMVGQQITTANTAWTQNTALSAEAEKRFATTASQLTVLWNRFKDIAITVGTALLPAIQTLMSVMNFLLPVIDGIARVFAALPGPIQLVIVGFFGLAAAIGPVMLLLGQLAMGVAALTGVGGFSGLLTMTKTLFSGVGTLLAPFTSLTGILGMLRTALAALAGPWGLIAAGAVTLATILWKVVGGWEGIKSILAPVIDLASDLATIFGHWADVLADTVVGALQSFWQWLGSSKDAVQTWGRGIFDFAIAPIKALIGWVAQIPGLSIAWDNFMAGIRLIGGVLAGAWASVSGFFGNIRARIDKEADDIRSRAAMTNPDGTPKRLGPELPKEMRARLGPTLPDAFKAPVERAPAALAVINKDAEKIAKNAERWKAAVADVLHDMHKLAVANNAAILEKNAEQAERTADSMLASFNRRTDAEREAAAAGQEIEFQRAEFAIEQAKRNGASWQQVYAMEKDLADARLQQTIDQAQLEFEIRTAWIDRTTAFGEAEYQALKTAHDAKVQGMVERHQQAEFLKRQELEHTHNVWLRSFDAIRAIANSLTDQIAGGFTQILTGAKSFKDAFLGIWQSIKQSLLDIFSDILHSFLKGFLDGMLNGILGRRGGFSSAFGGLLSGIGGGGGGGGILGGLFGTGGDLAMSGVGGLFGGGGGLASGAAINAQTAALGGAGTGGGFMGSMGAFFTNPFTIAAGAGALLGWAIWKKGLFRGGEEALQVSPRRDRFFSQFGDIQNRGVGGAAWNLASKLVQLGQGEGGGPFFAALQRADKVTEWETAQANVVSLLRRTGMEVHSFAQGGFIPPGVVAPAILHGGNAGEVIAPLDRMPGSVINFHATINALDAAGVKAAMPALIRELKMAFVLNQDGIITAQRRALEA